ATGRVSAKGIQQLSRQGRGRIERAEGPGAYASLSAGGIHDPVGQRDRGGEAEEVRGAESATGAVDDGEEGVDRRRGEPVFRDADEGSCDAGVQRDTDRGQAGVAREGTGGRDRRPADSGGDVAVGRASGGQAGDRG